MAPRRPDRNASSQVPGLLRWNYWGRFHRPHGLGRILVFENQCWVTATPSSPHSVVGRQGFPSVSASELQGFQKLPHCPLRTRVQLQFWGRVVVWVSQGRSRVTLQGPTTHLDCRAPASSLVSEPAMDEITSWTPQLPSRGSQGPEEDEVVKGKGAATVNLPEAVWPEAPCREA